MISDSDALEVLDNIPQVIIDGPGNIFKYIVIEYKLGTQVKRFIRGAVRHDYHGDIFDEFKASYDKLNKSLKSKCLGGGRIDHSTDKILIYGYSQGYGRANHKDASELVKIAFPDKDVQWNNDGY